MTPSFDKQAYGFGLRCLRLKEGLTQGDVARMLGLCPSTIGRWERGERVPHVRFIEPLAILLNVTLYDVLPHTPATPTQESDWNTGP